MAQKTPSFSEALIQFDEIYKTKTHIKRTLVPVDGKYLNDISLKDSKGKPNEEYYRWQFIYALIASKLYSRDQIGAEIYFPKGNKTSDPLRIDAVIFDSEDWLDLYQSHRNNKDIGAINTLRKLALCTIEFKRHDKRIDQVFSSQIRAAMREPERELVLGVYYDAGRLFLFKRTGEEILRLDNGKNITNSQRVLEKLQLEITDGYHLLPGHEELAKLGRSGSTQPSARKVEDLDIVYTISDDNVKEALNRILRALDSVSLFNEEGYLVLIQLIALKIYDEKQSELHGSELRFYLSATESDMQMHSPEAQSFIARLHGIQQEAKRYYQILSEPKINWKNARHFRVAIDVVRNFQRFSFIRSRKSDLYQLVFYNFATKFKKDENAQFLTPLPIIKFIVDIVNPRRNETVCDPCCGIGDFLSVSYVSSNAKLDDRNLYGLDSDLNMTLLAQLNMLLNGDGNAQIHFVPDKGSINHKLTTAGTPRQLALRRHKSGNWDDWPDETELLKFDVLLTNPPFGKGRSLDLNKSADLQVAQLYELHDQYVQENPKAGLDLGVVFLENAVRSVKTGGRFGIVLSNSIASNNTWAFARQWLMRHIRIVALFDLPPNVFAETGVNTTIVIGYKPSEKRLGQLAAADYSVFTREIVNVGYERKTVNRNVVFEPKYLLDPNTFATVIDENGESRRDEDFTRAVTEFREWCLFQEQEIKRLFLD